MGRRSLDATYREQPDLLGTHSAKSFFRTSSVTSALGGVSVVCSRMRQRDPTACGIESTYIIHARTMVLQMPWTATHHVQEIRDKKRAQITDTAGSGFDFVRTPLGRVHMGRMPPRAEPEESPCAVTLYLALFRRLRVILRGSSLPPPFFWCSTAINSDCGNYQQLSAKQRCRV